MKRMALMVSMVATTLMLAGTNARAQSPGKPGGPPPPPGSQAQGAPAAEPQGSPGKPTPPPPPGSGQPGSSGHIIPGQGPSEAMTGNVGGKKHAGKKGTKAPKGSKGSKASTGAAPVPVHH